MRFYGLSDQETISLPIARFWLLHRNTDRLAAEESIRTAQIGASMQSGEGFGQYMTVLRDQMGEVVKIDRAAEAMVSELDRAGLAALKAMRAVGSNA